MVLKMLRKKKGNPFVPGTENFPQIDVDVLSSGLRLEKRGQEDAKSGIPKPDAKPYTRAEQEAIERVRELRNRGLAHYELQIAAYESRIQGARAEREGVELKAGELRNAMQVESDKWSNHLTNERRSVAEYQEKLDAFRERNSINGPPRRRKNAALMTAVILIVLFLEAALSGVLFAQKNEMGLLGGVGIAFIISGVNVIFCLILGFGSRYVHLKSAAARLFGLVAFLLFPIFLFTLNLTVAHFRDALESFPWDAAAFEAIASLRVDPLGVRSFNSWIVFMFGVAVSLVAFLEGRLWLDPHPGYNQIYEDTQEAIEAYSESYEEAHKQLDKLFQNSSDELRAQAQNLRGRIRSALDAVSGHATLTRQLSAFLSSCDSAANQMLTRFREANIRFRSHERPHYFDTPFHFEEYVKPRELDVLLQEEAKSEIEKIDAIVEKGVKDILATRERAISAFPKVSELINEERVSRATSDVTSSPSSTHLDKGNA